MEHISEILEEVRGQKVEPIKTGIAYLDETIGGYYPGEMTTVCGEEGCCKTAFVIQQICKIAINEKVPTLLLLNYMLERNFLASMIAYYYSLEVDSVHDIFDKEKYKEIVDNFMSLLKDSPLYMIKAEWYVETPVFERIVNLVERKNVKMMFVDEVFYDLSLEDAAKLHCIRDIAVERNIPVVVTCELSNDRESFGGAEPLLFDLGRSSYLHGHDVVIGFSNYEEHRIFEDERGNDLHGIISIKVLKHRGKITKESYHIPKDYFYLHNYESESETSFAHFPGEKAS